MCVCVAVCVCVDDFVCVFMNRGVFLYRRVWLFYKQTYRATDTCPSILLPVCVCGEIVKQLRGLQRLRQYI